MGKTGNGMMKQSEESITRMTSYRFPHHDNRSFAAALDDVLLLSRNTLADPLLPLRITSYRPSHHDSRSFKHALDDDFPSAVIQHF